MNAIPEGGTQYADIEPICDRPNLRGTPARTENRIGSLGPIMRGPRPGSEDSQNYFRSTTRMYSTGYASTFVRLAADVNFPLSGSRTCGSILDGISRLMMR